MNLRFKKSGYTLVLFLLRSAIGWHLLYEGLIKLISPGWSAKGFLMNAQWVFGGVFRSLASDETLLPIIDQLNIWGLILIGSGLILGLFSSLAALMGIVLLSLYYIAYPPFAGVVQMPGVGGIFMIVNLVLIEMIVLVLLLFNRDHEKYGFDAIVAKHRKKRSPAVGAVTADKGESGRIRRRDLLKALATVPLAGAFYYSFARFQGWKSYEADNLGVNAISGATGSSIEIKSLAALEAKVPKAKIKDLEISRMIMGGNLIGGWAHARDLLYVNQLVKAYHTEEKVFRTLHMAEECGMNAIITNPVLSPLLLKYWKHGGRIKFISDGGWDVMDGVKQSVEMGASAVYIQGGAADHLVQKGDIDTIARALEYIKKNNLPAGIGAHELSTIKACVDYGLEPDFWMKTLHKTNYWSARIDNERKITTDPGYADNMYCFNPQETISYMNTLQQPWIAFKILAAGAIQPEDAFRWAFEQGADFICVGMYDFQMVDNVNLVCRVLKEDIKRGRPWRA
jgi:uncharacterized membrane protein YphA (DoxX/SURF4 family)